MYFWLVTTILVLYLITIFIFFYSGNRKEKSFICNCCGNNFRPVDILYCDLQKSPYLGMNICKWCYNDEKNTNTK